MQGPGGLFAKPAPNAQQSAAGPLGLCLTRGSQALDSQASGQPEAATLTSGTSQEPKGPRAPIFRMLGRRGSHCDYICFLVLQGEGIPGGRSVKSHGLHPGVAIAGRVCPPHTICSRW